MKRCLFPLAIVALCLVPLHADVTITQTMTIEGGAAAMMGGAQPTLVTRIKGTKARVDIDVKEQKVSTITDVSTKQMIVLNEAQKTAIVLDTGLAPSATPTGAMPKIDVSFKPTGQSRTIEGASCDEHAFTVTMSMAEMAAGGQMPQEAAEAMKDLKMVMSGSTWIARGGPGVDEYIQFQKAAAAQALGFVLAGGLPGQQQPGFEKLMAATASAPGVPYLTEMTMSFEGAGPMVEMMRQMGAMKMTQRTTAVSTEPIADDLFQVPADYKIEKKTK